MHNTFTDVKTWLRHKNMREIQILEEYDQKQQLLDRISLAEAYERRALMLMLEMPDRAERFYRQALAIYLAMAETGTNCFGHIIHVYLMLDIVPKKEKDHKKITSVKDMIFHLKMHSTNQGENIWDDYITLQGIKHENKMFFEI